MPFISMRVLPAAWGVTNAQTNIKNKYSLYVIVCRIKNICSIIKTYSHKCVDILTIYRYKCDDTKTADSYK